MSTVLLFNINTLFFLFTALPNPTAPPLNRRADLLPNPQPPLHPPSPHAILPNIISWILNIFLALLLRLSLPLQPILPPLLDILGLLEPLLRIQLARLLHVHFVDLNEPARGVDGVVQKVLARGQEVGVDGFGDEVEVPGCDG